MKPCALTEKLTGAVKEGAAPFGDLIEPVNHGPGCVVCGARAFMIALVACEQPVQVFLGLNELVDLNTQVAPGALGRARHEAFDIFHFTHNLLKVLLPLLEVGRHEDSFEGLAGGVGWGHGRVSVDDCGGWVFTK